MKDINSRIMTVSVKVTAYEKMRYNKIAKYNNISFSEWAASILSMYQNAYGELKINSYREDELLNEIDKLNKEVNFIKSLNKFLKTQLDSQKAGLRF
ncbi:hypothetical protein Q4Q39_04980 [Flavivirga amylovorans]|uniref:Uncharacterized protein n=1 Tax=Flavivirga amylovorans TaxID=870486 RepID=A0ABT8WYI5_9FLAO|nr:hypothetical protein [Flavivirga amylovorans]MDO5986756.1 hypothetical protein [Flavivirga amylovorans]